LFFKIRIATYVSQNYKVVPINNVYQLPNMKIEIKTILGSILFEYDVEGNTIAKTLIEAVRLKKYLTGADLTGAYLRGADLRGADLRGAYLRDADLTGADLTGADLRGADLRDADLRDADLRDADLTGADLRGADLKGAYLRDADLTGADLRGAYLRGAYLREIKHDLFALLLNAKSEIGNLKKSIIDGKVDGSTYEGECACLCGTLEKTENAEVKKRVYDLRDSGRPIERFFLGIKPGDTPETNSVSKIVLEWIEEFESLIK